ncbi:carbohydrate-binding module family 1 protein [Plenodomus tracheiphilus IPT5]|uniref:AA9 family lytic polysaccharide monooxygenase n=1 Tax=Plenodomus tracheiphilus IPT5 TaxID=1408161 RepID=A0A6A7B4E6_9PLEO|nr:carbohydrate-binding module family 1 protein [Plenodomus tracheiphilus IPT5]
MKTVAALSAMVALAQAHATWQQLWKNGEDLESTCARLPPSNSPIEDYTSTALQCNVSPAAASGKCGFEAGDTVTIEMHQHNTRDCKEEGIGGAHWGPVLAYMSKVEDAAAADGSSEFFKVYQNTWKKNPEASQGDNDFWGTKDLNYNCGKLDFKIPTDIAPGDYLLRAEAIALHSAGPAGGAQHYVTCYQLTVTGSGTLVPKGVTFPEAYSKDGPGLGFSIHADLSDYPAPGPALIASGTEATPQLLTFGEITGAPAAPKPVASTSKAVVASSAPVPASTSAAVEAAPSIELPAAPTTAEPEPSSTPTPEETVVAPVPTSKLPAPYPITNSTSSALIGTASPVPVLPSTFATVVRPQPTRDTSSGVITEYNRCGGKGFTGTGSCAAGLVCKEWNPYYFQCVKSDASYPVVPAPSAPASKPSKGPAAAPPKGPAAAPSATAIATPEPAQPSVITPVTVGDEPAEKTYTLETFIAFLEEEAGSASAAKMRRMIEALQN